MRTVEGRGTVVQFLDSSVGSYLVMAIVSLIAAVVCFLLVGRGAEISGKQGSLAFQAGGALGGFLIVFVLSYDIIRRLRRDTLAQSQHSSVGRDRELQREVQELRHLIQREREAHAAQMAQVHETRVTAAEALMSYRRRLKEVVDRHLDRNLSHLSETFRVWLWIGSTDGEDRVVEEHEMRAEGFTLLWHTVTARAVEEGTARHESFEAIEAEVSANVGAVDLLPLEEGPPRLKGMVVFHPEIGMEPRRWWFRYRWPGMWRNLRRTGRDHLEWDIRPYVTRFEVVVVMPSKGRPRVDFAHTPTHEGAEMESTQIGGDPALRWALTRPPAGRYYFALKTV